MREELIRKREAKLLTQAQMARKCKCSERLIVGIEEEDWITHPHIASRMAKEYGFNVNTYNQLVHETRRAKKLPKPVQPHDEKSWNGYAVCAGCRKVDLEQDPYMWSGYYK